MPNHPPEAEYLYCRVALEDGLHTLQVTQMTEEEAHEASLDLLAEEAEWEKVARADDDYFDAFYAEPLTIIASDALARAIGAEGEPIETLAALEARYFSIFRTTIRTAYDMGRKIRADMRDA